VNDRPALRLALAGDAILNRRVSDSPDEDVQGVIQILRTADLAFANCETLFHDYDGPHVYPAAEGGWSYMRSPEHIAGEMRALGFRLMSTANNHMLDYSYGGLFSTLAALTAAGIEHAGSGRDLAAARAPAFADAGNLRVGLVSMTSSSTTWSRAGMPHDGVPGRPGVNPLRFHFAVDRETMEQVLSLHTKLGWWITRVSEREWQINPPGLHNTITRYVEVDEAGAGMVLDEEDVAGNLRAIRGAKGQSDVVIAHIHNHEWDQERGTAYPPAFLPVFARSALDAGADVVFCQGTHAPMRGIEIHDGKPIFYDTGDLFSMSSTITRFPHDFYTRHASEIKVPIADALPVDGLAARSRFLLPMVVNPAGGYQQGRMRAGIIPVLHYDGKGRLERIELNPFVHRHATKGTLGVPFRANGEEARAVIAELAGLSEAFGTRIHFEDGKGLVAMDDA
jgi:poly-gamma-glutamate synthesis protein (capsule biosynthesis protein)